ncbi:MAG TPA: TM0106 family RecB-like putative nuclease [Gaiellaceae bacterium]|nr:TM0106 family RecB-like putative nuclease [Gaiellaceae bacterium]
MRLALDGSLRLSPSDLANYLACPHLTQLDVRVQRGELERPHRESAQADLIRRKGEEHEAAFLARLGNAGHEVVQIVEGDELDFEEAARRTEEALRDGAEIVYQGVLASGGWRGIADFLVRLDRPSHLGPFSYEAWDTKLARSHAKPAHVLQLTFYSHEIERIQGVLPERMKVVLGSGLEEDFRPADFAAFYRRARSCLTEAVATGPDPYPYPVDHCGICDFLELCDAQWDADDHLVRVASIRRDQIERLGLAGIRTLEALGDSPPGTVVSRMAPETFEVLRHQASLQLDARRTRIHHYDLLPPIEKRGLELLPPPSPGDLFYDIEGDPFFEPGRGLEYLHGITDAERRFTAIWAHDRDEEARAIGEVVSRFRERLAEHPDMHVYHYAPYEVSALKRLTAEHGILEDELDELLRRETFVDLYRVTRQAIRISYPSYSIKKVREFFMDAGDELEGGGDAIVEYERWIEERDPAILEAIQRYNEEDCLSNLLLRDWLLERRAEAESQYGVAIPWRGEPEPREPAVEATAVAAARAKLRRSLLATGDGTQALVGELLEYHRREARPVWWWFFERCAMTNEQLVEDSESIGSLTADGGEPERAAKSLVHDLRFPVQQHKLDPGDQVYDPLTMASAGHLVSVDSVAGTLRLQRGPKLAEVQLPTGLIPGGAWTTKDQQAALVRVGESLLAGDGRYPHLEKLLRREPPLEGKRVQCETLEEMGRLIDEVEGSYLFVQGPPGSGKTWTGARLITHLISRGKRVAIASQSHKAIHKLLAEVEKDALETGVPVRGLKKASAGNDESHYDGAGLIENTEEADDFADADHDLFAGTSWLLTRSELDGTLDYLFVDEAGQTSLADAAALGTCARTLVLLGDPVQLAQVTQGVHPEGAGASVLSHLLRERATVAEDMGLFLAHSHRMHPDVCRFVSSAFYEDRLRSAPGCEAQGSSFGTGLRWVPVAHTGNSTSSEEEATAIRAEIERLLSGTWTDAKGVTRPITPADVMVVSPFNAQVKLLVERLQAGIAVGTVDKFQGQEAPIVFFSMAASSGADAPRGIDFLLSRNRLNVAISRAQCLAYLACSPELLDVDCRTVEHMRLANALCRLVELAKRV